MERRKFLKTAATGGAAAALAAPLAAPAIAQEAPTIRWRLTSGFPRSLDTIYGAAETFADHVKAMSGGKIEIQVFPAGEIVPTPQAAEAVATNTVEMAHTCSYYYWGKDPTFALGTAVPFGLNARLMNGWLYQGGGNDMLNAFYAKQNLYGIAGGNTGVQMGGWWRKEITSAEDLKGVKMRIAGIAGKVMEKLGVVPQQIPGGDIYPSLERGTIDAAEWIGPYDDQKLGFNKVAPYYYYPGFWEGGPTIHFFINLDKWNELPEDYKAIMINAGAYANTDMMARYDTLNPGALKSLIAGGAKLKPFPQDVLEAAFAASHEVYDEISASNADFKQIWDSMKAYRGEGYLWYQVAEYSFDTFQIRNRTKG
ncbi:TRAP transporter substrate-binding protein [Amaricoccus solimangrovi]|uniref:Twin-arginine translocation signal domain-containing protein n=1 Tax=Amaricoccus solimangrovi TaxID=2589815 RepID=A0A501X1E0_9RHOB|nr:TRAP transporter substrate-binding protein [Amaricoccus solimangrovi]TPE53856.1 twin-arginine translocation signal domain-containing protein [Amaricoccus solimangrovi]